MGLRFVCALFIALTACASAPAGTREDRAEASAQQVERLLREARLALDQLDPETAERSLGEASQILESPDGRRHPDRAFLADDLKLAERRLVDVKKEVERREFERQVAEQQASVEAKQQVLANALAELKDPDQVSDEQLEAVNQAQEALSAQLSAGTALEGRSAAYAAWAKGPRQKLEAVGPATSRARRVVAFRQGPVRTRTEAEALGSKAQSESDPVEKLAVLIERKTKLESCARQGKEAFAQQPELKKLRFELGPQAKSGAQIVSACEREARAVGLQIKKLKKIKARPSPRQKR